VLTQSLRAALIEKTTADFVTAARAQGAGEPGNLLVHHPAERCPAHAEPVGVMVAFLIGGTIIVETVYAVPGLGSLMVNTLLGRDYLRREGLTLVFAVSTVLITL
jgi:peptide/nickel transport system permease protein